MVNTAINNTCETKRLCMILFEEIFYYVHTLLGCGSLDYKLITTLCPIESTTVQTVMSSDLYY